MNKRTLIEAVVGALLLVAELIFVLVRVSAHITTAVADSYLMYLLVIFTNIDVIYGVILLIVNSNKKD